MPAPDARPESDLQPRRMHERGPWTTEDGDRMWFDAGYFTSGADALREFLTIYEDVEFGTPVKVYGLRLIEVYTCDGVEEEGTGRVIDDYDGTTEPSGPDCELHEVYEVGIA